MKKIGFIIAAALMYAASALAGAPSYPGGDDAMQTFIKENLKYPENARQFAIEGVVNLDVQIKADGSIGTIKVVRMIDPDLEQEAIRVVKLMPAWIPSDDGDSVARVAIVFTLPEE